uniref:ditrans,polycis-polyprenyl diphosphate synthase [(2E,6E)-farnesyldiphosphate specific] n=1 Tax=Haemonchus contortus TaxID=6289 RepID=A0A7I4Z7J6_HAECO|nr:Nogo-B receptor [Haemonchus contortus]
MIDVAWLCAIAIRSVYWLVLLACNFLGYSTLWARREIKQREREEDIRRALKTPAHVAVLINNRSLTKDSLQSLLNVCLGANIRRLTIYDPVSDNSFLADDLSIFCKSKRIKIVIGCNSSPMDLSSYRLIVHLLSVDSGRATLVEACRDLSSSSTPITVGEVSTYLAKRHSLYEPEVLIQVGSIPSLSGYPPWCLRVTEIIPVRVLPCTRYAFEECLEAYSKREIRLGK